MTTNFGGVTDAVRALRDGGVVLVPTETVVGLVCAEEGLPKIYDIKGRDANKPVALLCRDADEAFALAREVPDVARSLAARFWPGPLTVVLKSRQSSMSIGLRVPLGTVKKLLEACGGPLYGTSANISGEVPAESLGGVDSRIVGLVDVVVEGEGGGGEASAVVDLSREEPRLIRESAALTEKQLREISESVKKGSGRQ